MELDALVARTREFIRAEVLEIDDHHDGDIEAAGGDEFRMRLQALAAKAGLLALHAPVDCGGLGLGMVDRGLYTPRSWSAIDHTKEGRPPDPRVRLVGALDGA